MYEPTRGGTRGGQAEFKWSDVGQDKNREHYLGHSINAPTGRWQKNKDVHWYNREQKQTDEEKQLEIAKIKEAEREAMSVALGFKPSKPAGEATTSGANAIPVAGAPQSVVAAGTRAVLSDAQSDKEDDDDQKEDHKLSKEEKRLRKIEKKLAKAEKKRLKREEKEALAMQQIVRQRERERPRNSRSASPARRGERSYALDRDRDRSHGEDGRDYTRERRRSRSRERSTHADRRDKYDEAEMERERAKDRKRWGENLARQEKARGNWD